MGVFEEVSQVNSLIEDRFSDGRKALRLLTYGFKKGQNSCYRTGIEIIEDLGTSFRGRKFGVYVSWFVFYESIRVLLLIDETEKMPRPLWDRGNAQDWFGVFVSSIAVVQG